jgi:hypothetical protein
VSITVNPVNDPPVADNQAVSTPEDTLLVVTLTASDVDNDPLTYAVGTGPAHGTLSGTAPDLTYTPAAGYNGPDSFTFHVNDGALDSNVATVSITVNALLPVTVEVRVAAGTDDAEERATGSMYISSSDLELVLDKDNQTVGMRFVGVSIPQGATIQNAYVQFTADKAGSDSTSLTVVGQDTDDAATFSASINGDISSRVKTSAEVDWPNVPVWAKGAAGTAEQTPDLSSVIQEIVDRPGWTSGNSLVIIITGTGKRVAESYNGSAAGAPLLHVEYYGGPPNSPPLAADDAASTSEDTAVTIDVAANDTDPDGSLDLASTNTACTTCASTTNGSLANNGDGTFTYTPDADFSGGDSFAYEICDDRNACDTATVAITVDAVNDPPLAADDTATTGEGTTVTIDVAANDTDPDANLDPSSANVISGPSNGVLVNNGDGTFGYTPAPNYNGPDGFVYEICDSGSPVLCDTAAVSITVTVTNEPPVANDDGPTTPEDTAVPIDVAANDTDTDGNLAPASANTACATCAEPANGTLLNNADGTFTYTPAPDWNGSDSFVYEICDTLGACDTATVSITVDPVADPPLAVDDAASTPQDTPVTIDVAANDTDPDGNLDPSSATAISGPANGTLVNVGDGTFDYTPDAGYSGVDSFVYEICDASSLCDTATVSITVTALPSTTTLVGAGDIATCSSVNDEATASLLDSIAGGVFTLGDNANPDGSTADYANCYDPTWGRHKARTRPAAGDNDYNTSGASPYFDYFGAAAGDAGKGYYSYDAGDWHVVVLNSNCGQVGGCDSASPQGQWLRADLVANPSTCTLAYWHEPLFTSRGGTSSVQDFWQILYEAGADVVLNGHRHYYERFAPQDANGNPDPEHGIREFVVGTGGDSSSSLGSPITNLEIQNGDTHGVLKLTLHPDSYDWEFVPIAGSSFTDSGSAPCVVAPPINAAPAVTIAAPADGSTFSQGDAIAFSGTAYDPEDGDLTAGLTWTSSLDGPIGSGASFSRSDLSVGVHTIVATTADNAGLPGSDRILLTVTGNAGITEVRVSASTDDAEERATGSMYITSTDLELVLDRDNQTVGMRFVGVPIPQGATILSAYVQFQVDETGSDPTSLTIQGQASDDTVTFTSSTGNISSRARTTAAVSWVPAPWNTKGQAGPDQRTPDLSPVIQEIVNRLGWSSGNSLVIIITGTGKRTAEAYDGTAAPLLHVEYDTGN